MTFVIDATMTSGPSFFRIDPGTMAAPSTARVPMTSVAVELDEETLAILRDPDLYDRIMRRTRGQGAALDLVALLAELSE